MSAPTAQSLRTLFDIQLPKGTDRLWLPVLSTQAKRDACAANSYSSPPVVRFAPYALVAALKTKLFWTDALAYKVLVHKLLQQIGKGPWSDDPGQFGKQLQYIIDIARKRGLKVSIANTKRGSEVTLEEILDEEDFDPTTDYDSEWFASWETMQRKREAEALAVADDFPPDE